MIIVGEKLNSSIPKTLDALNAMDEDYLVKLAKRQEKCGADYLDINTAICGELETEKLLWLVDCVLQNTSCGIMIDSPSTDAIIAALNKIQDRKVIINSVTLTQRIDELLPVIAERGCGVVALPMDENGIPDTAEKRLDCAKRLIERLTKEGVEPGNIFIDAITESLSVGDKNAVVALDTIRAIKEYAPQVHTVCGLSNVSFGLPQRISINCAFLSAAIACGLDSAIMDITLPAMRTALFSALAVSGRDEYCMNYISFVRESN